MLEFFSFSFFQNALIGALLVSIACGLIGPWIMVNRLFSMAGGITHGAFGGIGIAIYFALPILLSTGIFTILLAFFVAILSKKYPNRSDNIIAVIWAFGMALGLIFIDLTPGYKGDLMTYLFGSILLISLEDLVLMAICDFIFIILIFMFFTQFEALSFDEEFTRLKGVNTNIFYYILITMIAICIVLCIRVVGLVLVLALLSIPCFIAEKFTKKLFFMMIISCILSMIFCILGIILSVIFDLSSGASIIMVSCLCFLFSILGKNYIKRLNPLS